MWCSVFPTNGFKYQLNRWRACIQWSGYNPAVDRDSDKMERHVRKATWIRKTKKLTHRHEGIFMTMASKLGVIHTEEAFLLAR